MRASAYGGGMDDVADLLEQPRCPSCGTVLRDAPPGYRCASCGLLFLRGEVPMSDPSA